MREEVDIPKVTSYMVKGDFISSHKDSSPVVMRGFQFHSASVSPSSQAEQHVVKLGLS